MKNENQTAEERIQKQREEWITKRRATEIAKRRLAAEGVAYPLFMPGDDPEAYYTKLQAYAQKEAAYILEALRAPSGPRPIIEFPKREWEPYKE